MEEKKARMILNQVTATYDGIAGEFSRTRQNVSDLDYYAKYLAPGMKILDLGCGNGRLIGFLAKHYGGKSLPDLYTGIDNSKKLLELASNSHPGFKFVRGDQLQIPLADNCTDIIFNIRAFHHIPSLKLRMAALAEMRRVLHANGILIITVWNLWQPKYYKYLFQSIFKWIKSRGSDNYNDTLIPWGGNDKRYYHAFTAHELKENIIKSGFKIIENVKIGHDFAIIAAK